jgi:hypothetical protein
MSNLGSTHIDFEGTAADIDALVAFLATTRAGDLEFTLAGIAGDPFLHGHQVSGQLTRQSPTRLVADVTQDYGADATGYAEALAERLPALTVGARCTSETMWPEFEAYLWQGGKRIAGGKAKRVLLLPACRKDNIRFAAPLFRLPDGIIPEKSALAALRFLKRDAPWAHTVAGMMAPLADGWRLAPDIGERAAWKPFPTGALVILGDTLPTDGGPSRYIVLHGVCPFGTFAGRRMITGAELMKRFPAIARAFGEDGSRRRRPTTRLSELPDRTL